MKNYVRQICALLFFGIFFIACDGTTETPVSNANGQAKQSNSAPTTSTQTQKFSNVTTKLPTFAFGGVDSINEVVAPKIGSVTPITKDKFRIAGNYIDEVKKDVAAGVVIMIGDKTYEAVYGGERPDIAKTLNNPKYLKSQFYLEVPTSEIGKGIHEVKIRVIANDMSGYYEGNWYGRIDVK